MTLMAVVAVSENLAAAPWQYGADLRAGLFVSERDGRDGSVLSEEELHARLRLSAQRDLAPGWRFRTRLAGRFTTAGNDPGFRIERYRASRTGTRPGEVHPDEFFIQGFAAEDRYRLRLGRFQTSFNLPVVPGKSLDRNDSSNVGIGWTDGMHLELPLADGWRTHWIAQINHRKGAGNTIRAPLAFDAGGSRVGSYAALEGTELPGPLSWALLSIGWMPNALAPGGLSDSRREDYLTGSAKLAATWVLGESGTRLVAAAEAGRAFNQPDRAVMQLNGEGAASGKGYQASLNLFDFRPGHHVGVVYGQAGAGWLISNDYRNNDELAEIRYQRRFSPELSVEIRYRWRRELESLIGAQQRQTDRDAYVRVSWRIF